VTSPEHGIRSFQARPGPALLVALSKSDANLNSHLKFVPLEFEALKLSAEQWPLGVIISPVTLYINFEAATVYKCDMYPQPPIDT
jgi:hypothetical protein